MSHRKHMSHFYGLLEWSILLAALCFAVSFIYVAYNSMPFPFMLEWMEGQTIDVIERIFQKAPLYTSPDIEYVPLIYPPYYFYVSAFVRLLTGGDFYPARLTSFMATLGTTLLIYHWLRKENAGWRYALIGACIFLATYKLSGRWFDMSRVDSLFLFLTFAGVYVSVHSRGFVNIIGAVALLTMAFFTKQTALIIAAPVLFTLMFVDARHAISIGVLLLVSLLTGIYLLDNASSDWFSFYAFTVPAGHRMEPSMLFGFWKKDVFGRVGIFFVMSLAAIAFIFKNNKGKAALYFGMATGFIMASYLSRMHSYGYINVLMPMHLFLSLMTGLCLYQCRHMTRAHIALPLAGILVLIELATLIYNPSKLIPGEKMMSGSTRFLQEIAAIEGDIFMPEIQYIQTRIGKKSYAFGMAGFDVLRAELHDMNYVKDNLLKKISLAIRGKRFSAIIPGRMVRIPELRRHYQKSGYIHYDQHYVTGAIGRLPTDIYVPAYRY